MLKDELQALLHQYRIDQSLQERICELIESVHMTHLDDEAQKVTVHPDTMVPDGEFGEAELGWVQTQGWPAQTSANEIDQIGPYDNLGVLGIGGMGEVLRVVTPSLIASSPSRSFTKNPCQKACATLDSLKRRRWWLNSSIPTSSQFTK